ncbi:MAG: betaine/proline/choline family ABC transporter ATP-binding protein [Spirochaetes bacterium]|jgi:glycine betaine/proline transport system ATP-binding protein|nr:betaine/proline/choline family ABC transporter ATP-binding protein [Spirochaetota bacterium]
MSDDKAKVRVESITKIYGHRPHAALKMIEDGHDNAKILSETGQAVGVVDASFDVKEGETVVVMGLSGSGKSTLIRCINRLITPTSGKVWIDDTEVTALDDEELRMLRRDRLSMVFQHFALFPHMTIIENVAYGLRIQGVGLEKRNDAALQALESVGLRGWEDNLPEHMSGGMKQRVGLARALATDPDILLMDEPFSALDPLIRTEVQDELLAMEEKLQKTIIFITHDLDEALKMGDRIVLMKDGRMVQIGTSEQILTEPANEYVRNFVEDVDVTKVLNAEDIMKPVKTVAYLKDGPHTALHKMERAGISGIFAVTRDGTFKGHIEADTLSEAVEKGNAETVEALIDPYEAQTVRPDTPIREVYQRMHEETSPIAVVEESGRLKGVIVRGGVIGGLAERGSIDQEAEGATND